MTNPRRTEDLDAVGALAETVRRRLYEFVAASGEPVDRESAATGVGIGRPLAAFHLDRLVAAGLLGVVFRRRSGRSGPGAGRPAKFYVRPPDRELAVHLPPRGYDLAAEILAEGVERAAGGATRTPAADGLGAGADPRASVLEAARERGAEMAAEDPGSGLVAMLESAGYEPFAAPDGTLRLRNCPFHALVDEHRDLTCSMNLALLGGAASALEAAGYRAVARPEEGLCCVAFVPEAEDDEPADG